MRATTDSPRETVTCPCRVCGGAAALVPTVTLAQVPDQRVTLVHNYVQMARHMPSVARRAFVEAV